MKTMDVKSGERRDISVAMRLIEDLREARGFKSARSNPKKSECVDYNLKLSTSIL